jgi:hypothetical protein
MRPGQAAERVSGLLYPRPSRPNRIQQLSEMCASLSQLLLLEFRFPLPIVGPIGEMHEPVRSARRSEGKRRRTRNAPERRYRRPTPRRNPRRCRRSAPPRGPLQALIQSRWFRARRGWHPIPHANYYPCIFHQSAQGSNCRPRVSVAGSNVPTLGLTRLPSRSRYTARAGSLERQRGLQL